jgi:hypothetical protein
MPYGFLLMDIHNISGFERQRYEVLILKQEQRITLFNKKGTIRKNIIAILTASG